MNSKDLVQASCAADAARKRAAAKKLIERYYYQLTDGCGNPHCTNEHCASSGKIQLACDQAAILAIQLFMGKAKLCESNPAKMAKIPNKNYNDLQAAQSSVGTSIHEATTALVQIPMEESDVSIKVDHASNPNRGGVIKDRGECVSLEQDDVQKMDLPTIQSSNNPSRSGMSKDRGECVSLEHDDVQKMELPMIQPSNSPSRSGVNNDRGECVTLEQDDIQKMDLPTIQPSTSSSGDVLVSPSVSEENKLPHAGSQGETYLNEAILLDILERCKLEGSYSLLIRTLGQVFSSEESLKISFLKEKQNFSSKDNLTKEDIRAMEVDEDKDQDSKEIEEQSEATGSLQLKSFDVTVDIESVRRAFSALFAIPNQPFQHALINALLLLSGNLEMKLKYHKTHLIDTGILNIFVIVMEIPILENPEYLEAALPAFCKAAALLPIQGQAKLARVLSGVGPTRLKEMVDTLHQLITLRVISGSFSRDYFVNDEETIVAATKLMKILFYSNILGGEIDREDLITEENEQNDAEDSFQELLHAGITQDFKEPKPTKEDPLGQELGVKMINCRTPVIPFEEFYNEPLSDQIEMDRDFAYYKSEHERFSFMNYSFILTPAVKILGLYYDNRIRMYSERRISVLQSLVHGAPPNPYLRLRVRRDHIIDDALVGLEMIAMESPTNLKKQLVVEFEGEQGIDEGGISKEFFQLVVDEIFNPDFAMFTLNPETQTYWFNPTSFESDAQFTLIGIILGLAIYNNVILDVQFPMVVYRKLMGKKGTFYDLFDWNQSLAKGLQELLSYEGDDMEEVFMQTFRITYQDVFGILLTHDLKENGEQIYVNQTNKQEFIDLYADFLLNKSIEKQFRAFRRGFQMVTDDSPLKMLFRPEEVELLVCGSKNFDFNALEESTEYDGGYTAETPIIRAFWELVHEFSLEQKKKLLQFTTGSDRVPVGGLSKLKLVIARHGPDSERLPTAHTCFNVLLLPEYSSKDKLQERLLKAINYSKGFGML